MHLLARRLGREHFSPAQQEERRFLLFHWGQIKPPCECAQRLASRGDVQIVYPVHPNPNVTGPVNRFLRNVTGIQLIDPLPYIPFVGLMRKAHVLLTDSGGIQEEGPSLGKPVLVMREKTERPEAVIAGTARLVGVSEERIVEETALLLDNEAEYQRRTHIHNPYGDGRAAERIRDVLAARFTRGNAGISMLSSA